MSLYIRAEGSRAPQTAHGPFPDWHKDGILSSRTSISRDIGEAPWRLACYGTSKQNSNPWEVLAFGHDKRGPQLYHRLQEYIGPSWSWTSVPGEASFLYVRAAGPDIKLVCLDAAVELIEPKARYGAVTHGCITVLGRLRGALYGGALFGDKGDKMEVQIKRMPSGEADCDLIITKAFPDHELRWDAVYRLGNADRPVLFFESYHGIRDQNIQHSSG